MSLNHQAAETQSKTGGGLAMETYPTIFNQRHKRSDRGGSFSLAGARVNASPYIHSMRKRAMDVILSLIILAIIGPVFIVISAVVKLTSAGPVIFQQKRNGKGGRHFAIFKFRTMHHEPEDASAEFVRQASRTDSRVTPVGFWLRRLSLDELPQIINVLQGKMSLVGPRPHALSHDAYYSKHVVGYMSRYQCRPGITGLAQVSGSRGETASHEDMQRRVDFDLDYISRASLKMDLVIIVKTALKLFDVKNVY